jgi:hypothetical protein
MDMNQTMQTVTTPVSLSRNNTLSYGMVQWSNCRRRRKPGLPVKD